LFQHNEHPEDLVKLSAIEEKFLELRLQELYDRFENMLINHGDLMLKELQTMITKHV
jgi:hypothetical protein